MAARQHKTLRIWAWLIPIILVGLSFSVTDTLDTERIVYLAQNTPFTPTKRDVTSELTDNDSNTIWHIDHLRYFGIENFLFIHFPSDQVKRANQHKSNLCFSIYPRPDAPTNTFKSISFSGSNNGIFFTSLGIYTATRSPQVSETYSSCIDSDAYNVIRVSFMNGYRAHRFYSIADLLIDFSRDGSTTQNLTKLPSKLDTSMVKLLSKASVSALALSIVFLVTLLTGLVYFVSRKLYPQSTFVHSLILPTTATAALFIVANPYNWFNIVIIGIISFFICCERRCG